MMDINVGGEKLSSPPRLYGAGVYALYGSDKWIKLIYNCKFLCADSVFLPGTDEVGEYLKPL